MKNIIIELSDFASVNNLWSELIENFGFEKAKKIISQANDLQKMNVLRRIIAPMGTMDAIEFINSKLKDTKNNAEFFNSMNKPS